VCNVGGVLNGRVLIADDQANSRELLRIVFEHHGYEVSEASDGLEAVRLALATNPDLVLLDLELPGLDGYAAARRLRDDGHRKPGSIIALASTDEDVDVLRAAGFGNCITKPVVFRELSGRIPQFLG
jgi:DNA-binding response OmpR family regulator